MSAIGPSSKGLSVITVPVKMETQIAKAAQIKKVKHKKHILSQSRKGNLQCPIITCKNSKLNFYKGEVYDKFQRVSLASQGWNSRKAKHDFFMLHKYADNPAFLNDTENDENNQSSFLDLGLDTRIVEQFAKNGFHSPTKIQKLAIPPILEGSNTLIAAETGNGKTYAFLAPILHQVLKMKQENSEVEMNSPKALVIVPGRELVTQTKEMARLIGNDLGIQINSVIGGRTKRMMLNPKIGAPDVLIGSFGALSKLRTLRVYKMHRVKHIVLDEVDTLLDDSFNDYTTHFLSKFSIRGKVDGEIDESSGAQLSLVGATFPRSLHTILDKIVDLDSLVHVKTAHLHRILPHVSQTFIRVGHDERATQLLKLAKRNHKQKIPTIIFSNNSKCSAWVTAFLNGNDIPCVHVSGDMRAFQRPDKYRSFVNEEVNFISCTDLVSRGLNTIRAKHILNFEFPKFISDYIHRCGRVGRVGSSEDCHVTNFIFRGSDVELAQKIEYAARKSEDLPQVNANIKRIMEARREKYELRAASLQEGDD